jgi:hypothetical protein
MAGLNAVVNIVLEILYEKIVDCVVEWENHK